jgi:dipeptidyl-peptidase-4
MLTQQGYIVASVDNRGTPSPRGRAFRKAIYGKDGQVNIADIAAAATEIVSRPFIDETRVGTWGWSGGGSMALNLLFQYPDLYHTAVAVAPVTNQKFYDTIYTERYMGLPQDNAEGYRLGDPATYVDQLRGNLLLIHGTGDDNVHFQNSEVLINAMIGANKPFTMMAYPGRSHGIFEGEGTTLHLYNLITRYLNDNLPAGGRDATS